MLVRFFSHAGHMQGAGSADDEVFGMVLKLIVIMDFSDRECLFVGEEAGHKGDSFATLLACA